MDFETYLLRGIPPEEAADFFIRVRGSVKEATPAEFNDAVAALPPEEREELLKSAGVGAALESAIAHPGAVAAGGAALGAGIGALAAGKGHRGAGALAGGAAGGALGAGAGYGGRAALHSAYESAGKGHTPLTHPWLGKTAMGAAAMGAGPPPMPQAAPLPPSGKGMNMNAQAPMPLPPTAMGQQPGMKMSAAPADERGEERARANFAAAHERDRLTRGERWLGGAGKALGGPAGMLAGGAGAFSLARKLPDEVVTPAGKGFLSLGGAALGGYLGHRAGENVGGGVGHALDVRRFRKDEAKKHESKEAAAFKLALQETGMAPQGIEPQLDPATQQYLQTTQMGDTVAEQNEAQFLRMKLQVAQQEAQQASTQAAQLQDAQAQHDTQMAQIQQQVSDSTLQANAAQDQVLQQQQAAAAMRMAFQQLRGTLLEAASAEPPSLTPTPGSDAAAAGASQAAGPSSAPAPTNGPAGLAPQPGTAPGSPAPMGDDTVSAPSAPNEPMFGNAKPTTSVGQQEQTGDAKIPNKEVLSHFLPFVGSLTKRASLREALAPMLSQAAHALPHAAIGAGLGAAAAGYDAFSSNDPLKQKVQALEAKPGRSYSDTASLAGARAHLTMSEHAKEHPGVAMGMGALGGALGGVALGPGIVRAAGHAAAIGKNVKDIFSKGAARC